MTTSYELHLAARRARARLIGDLIAAGWAALAAAARRSVVRMEGMRRRPARAAPV